MRIIADALNALLFQIASVNNSIITDEIGL
jgi:hypothetical protein